MRLFIAALVLLAFALIVRSPVLPGIGNDFGFTFYRPLSTQYVPFRVAAFWLLIGAAIVLAVLGAVLRLIRKGPGSGLRLPSQER